MVKSDYKGLCGLPLSSLSKLADSSDNDMDPSDLCVIPGSGGSSSSSDGNGGRSVNTSSSTSADDGGSGSSSASSEVELDHSRHQANPEDSPAPNLQRLLLVSPAATEDDVLIMDGVLVDNGPGGAPSSARHSVSFADNGLGNRRSASISNLLLVSSGSQGATGGGSGSRRSGFGGQFYQRRDREEPRGTQPQRNRYYEGSSNRWQAGTSNVQQGQQLPLPYSVQQLPQQYPFHMNMAPPPYFSPWLAGPRAAYTYAPTAVTTQPAHYSYNQPGGSSGGGLPVDIRRPDGTPLSLPPPAPPRLPVAPLVIRAPPASGGGTPAPERSETQPPPPPRPAALTARTFSWPPTVEEESAIWYALHGTTSSRRRARLPVFKGICSDGTEGQAPPPPPAPPCP